MYGSLWCVILWGGDSLWYYCMQHLLFCAIAFGLGALTRVHSDAPVKWLGRVFMWKSEQRMTNEECGILSK